MAELVAELLYVHGPPERERESKTRVWKGGAGRRMVHHVGVDAGDGGWGATKGCVPQALLSSEMKGVGRESTVMYGKKLVHPPA